jgi:hypothetical protein
MGFIGLPKDLIWLMVDAIPFLEQTSSSFMWFLLKILLFEKN